VVDHHREIPVSALVGDLIDPDPGQPGEPVMQRLDIGPDPGDDRAHGAPGDPHQLSHRGLGALGRQPGDLLIEDQGVAGTVPGPLDRGHRGAVRGTVHPWCGCFQHDLDGAKIQRPPPAPSLTTVIGSRSALATTAPGPSPRPSSGSHMSHQQLLVLVELDVLHDRLLDPQQGAP
jgi:hypothetical protein